MSRVALAALALAAPGAVQAQEVRSLGADEIEAILARLEAEPADLDDIGFSDYDLGWSLSEEETRALIEVLFRKNGLALLDGYDPTARIGFVVDAAEEERSEVALEHIRSDRAILVLECGHYRFMEYEQKTAAIDRLLEDARRFLVGLACEGRLPR